MADDCSLCLVIQALGDVPTGVDRILSNAIMPSAAAHPQGELTTFGVLLYGVAGEAGGVMIGAIWAVVPVCLRLTVAIFSLRVDAAMSRCGVHTIDFTTDLERYGLTSRRIEFHDEREDAEYGAKSSHGPLRRDEKRDEGRARGSRDL